MLNKKLTLILFAAMIFVTGCVGAMVNQRLNRHLVKPDVLKLVTGSVADEEVAFYYNVLKDYENFFVNLKARPFNEKEKQEAIRMVKSRLDETIVAAEKLGQSRTDAMRIIQGQVRREKVSLEYSYRPKTLPNGALWGRIVTKNEIAIPAIGALHDTASALFFYPASTDEEANRLRRTLFTKMADLGFSKARWTVKDITLNGYGKPLAEIDWPKVYEYWWESPYKSKIDNRPNTDQLLLMFSVEKKNSEFGPGVNVIATLIINKEAR